VRTAFDETFYGLGRPWQADLIYIALDIAVTLDIFSEIAAMLPFALVTDALQTRARHGGMARLFSGNSSAILGGHPMAGQSSSPALPPRTRHFPGTTLTRRIAEGEAIAMPDRKRTAGLRPCETPGTIGLRRVDRRSGHMLCGWTRSHLQQMAAGGAGVPSSYDRSTKQDCDTRGGLDCAIPVFAAGGKSVFEGRESC